MRTLDNTARELMREEARDSRIAADPRANKDEHFLDQRVKDAIDAVIAQLKPRERDFLRMYYFEELPKEEIARRIGIAEERVRLLKSRTLKSFRERFLKAWRPRVDTKRNG